MKNFGSRSLKRASDLLFSSRKTIDAGLVLLGLVIIPPLLWIVGYSLAYSVGAVGRLSQGLTLEHWRWAMSSKGVLSSVGLSLTVAGAVALIATALSLTLVLAYPGLRNRPSFLWIACVLLGTPSAIIGFLAYQILSAGGLVARTAHHLGWVESPDGFPQLVNDPYAIGMIASLVVGSIPLLSLYFSQLWTTIQADRLCQLAMSLGATLWQARVKVALPMLLTRGRSMIVLVFLWTMGSYEIPLLLGRQSPQMFSVLTQRRSGLFDIAKRPEAFVLATIYFGLTALMLCLYLRWRERHE